MSEKLSLSLLLRRFDKRTLVGHFDKLQEPLNKYFRRYASKTLDQTFLQFVAAL